ncbi:hypothetical protein BGX33_002824 [Mortierella sp. NVP41]|nr:hypothetical protein BGX33_002824 [Mortierella sp. NVP41]
MPPPATLGRVLEALKANDVNAQLAVFSDDQLIKDTELHRALLYQPDALMRLLELEDVYVQFAVYRLVKAILLNNETAVTTTTDTVSDSMQLLHQRRQVVQTLVQKLVSIDQNCSGTGRAILELFHGLLKDHRHLVRNLNDQEDVEDDRPTSSSSSSSSESKEVAGSQHAAVAIVQELSSSPEFWRLTMDRFLGFQEMQHAVVVLMIDIEKARLVTGCGRDFYNAVISCHKELIAYMDKLMTADRIGSLPLKKHLELICLTMKPPSPPPHHPTGQQQQDIGYMKQESGVKRPLEIFTALSPIVLDTLKAFRELDPDLVHFSTGRTTFILSDSPVHNVNDNPKRATAPRISSLLANPEAVRQLGRICLTAVLSILDNLTIFDGQIMELTRDYLVPFIQEWIGDQTLQSLLTIYGEDDAGVSWLLKTMSQIHRRLLDLRSLQQSQNHNHHRDATVDHSTATHPLDKVYTLLDQYVHPLEGLFLFLETVGYDYQTVLDLLLTLDDKETGGMLAAVMVVLRSFTEDSTDQDRLVQRWRQEIQQEQQQLSDSDSEDEDVSTTTSTSRRLVLFNVDHCLGQLTHQIRQLHKNNLFPYNPRPLLHVLDHTQDILFTVLSD